MSKEIGKVKAKKGDRTATFSTTAWQLMGADKNGWEEVGKTKASTENAAKDLDEEQLYRQLVEQGKGFAKDGKHGEALAKFEAAAELKPSGYIKGEINKVTAALAEASENSERDALIADGDAMFEEEDYATALELYGAAQGIEVTDEVQAKVDACAAKLK